MNPRASTKGKVIRDERTEAITVACELDRCLRGIDGAEPLSTASHLPISGTGQSVPLIVSCQTRSVYHPAARKFDVASDVDFQGCARRDLKITLTSGRKVASHI